MKQTVISILLLAVACWALAGPAESENYPLDWRYNQFEPGFPMLGKSPAGSTAGLHGRVVTTAKIKSEDVIGDTSKKTFNLSVWRNERVNGQFVLWSNSGVDQVRLQCSALLNDKGGNIPPANVKARFVRFVLGGSKLLPDILDPIEKIDIPAGGYRPVWLTVTVPENAVPGLYKGIITVKGANKQELEFPVELNVLSATLPPPAEWSFYLDLWQHPWAVARYHRVEPFSKEHYALLRPLLSELAAAGQKTLTTSIVDKPWNQQTFDPYDSMIKHIKNADESWSFDFSLFDEYVEFGATCGLNKHIHCYTMVTWGNMVSYVDAKSGDKITIKAVPGTQEHVAYWKPFLLEFEKHLKQKGWLERTYIAMDERGAAELRATMLCIKKYAPGLKVSMAGNHPPSSFKGLEFDNYSQSIGHVNPAFLDEVQERRKDGRITTFYVCCGPRRPNTFVFSPTSEQHWLGYYAAANQLDGFLRWAFAHWNRDPLYNTAFGKWPDGDTFLVYPGMRSSMRWECLRDGIEEYEKIRILREQALVDSELTGLFKAYDFKNVKSYDDAKLAGLVEKTRAAVERQSAKLK